MASSKLVGKKPIICGSRQNQIIRQRLKTVENYETTFFCLGEGWLSSFVKNTYMRSKIFSSASVHGPVTSFKEAICVMQPT